MRVFAHDGNGVVRVLLLSMRVVDVSYGQTPLIQSVIVSMKSDQSK